MIKALIIEDENLAVDYLKTAIKQTHHDIEILESIDSVENAVVWFKNNPLPDLIFLDVQLSDGLSFEIFSYVNVSCPVIFTTAYEEYAIKAFKINSVDYLLKPIRTEDLSLAIDKYLNQTKSNNEKQIKDLQIKVDQLSRMISNQYKTRFIVNAGLHIRTIETQKVSCFYSLGKSIFLQDENGKSYDINFSLEQLEGLLDPKKFFRVSRQYIINIDAIKDIVAYSGRRFKLKINSSAEEVLVSRAKMSDFKIWLDR